MRRRVRWPLWLVAAIGLGVLRGDAEVHVTQSPTSARAGVACEGARRAKGGPRLTLYRQVGAGAQRLRRGARVGPGERIQVVVWGGGAAYGVIYSVDGWGQVTLHFPAHADASAALGPWGPRPLPYSFELDGAPTYERFFFVVASTPIAVAPLLAAARRAPPPRDEAPWLPSGLDLADEFLVRKR